MMLLKRRELWCTVVCLLIAILQIAVFYPGYISHDVVHQLDQARLGPINDVSPPAAALLLRFGQRFAEGTGFVFVLNTFLFWGSMVLLLRRARVGPLWFLALVVSSVPLWLLLPHVWTDIHLLSVLATYVALVSLVFRVRHKGIQNLLWLMAFLCLAWSTWVRHNAILAVIPLLWLLVPRLASVESSAGMLRLKRIGLFGLLILILLVLRSASGLVVEQRASTWAIIPLWDLQVISIATNQQLLPEGFVGEGMTVEQLQKAFSPNTNVPLFTYTTSGVRNPTLERFDQENTAKIFNAWADAVAKNPGVWAQHRIGLMLRMLGSYRTDDLVHMVDSPRFLPDANRTALQTRLHQQWRGLVDWLKQQGFASPWLSIVLLAFFLVWRYLKQEAYDEVIVCLVLSAMAYGGGLLLLAPSAELRYLAWPIWAVLFAVMFGASVRKNTSVSAAKSSGAGT